MQRVFEEIESLKAIQFSPDRVAAIRQNLMRELDENRQDNGYLLNQIARSYEDGDAANIADGRGPAGPIAALTGEAIQQAARSYLDTSRYVKVTLMPEGK